MHALDFLLEFSSNGEVTTEGQLLSFLFLLCPLVLLPQASGAGVVKLVLCSAKTSLDGIVLCDCTLKLLPQSVLFRADAHLPLTKLFEPSLANFDLLRLVGSWVCGLRLSWHGEIIETEDMYGNGWERCELFERLLIEMQEIRGKVRERQCYICTRIPIILCEVCWYDLRSDKKVRKAEAYFVLWSNAQRGWHLHPEGPPTVSNRNSVKMHSILIYKR